MGNRYGVGIDIGSTCAKTVVVNGDGAVVWHDLRPTSWSSIDTAGAIKSSLPKAVKAGQARFVATGYGRVSVPFADKCVTEISCHGKGASRLFGEKNLNVIDIGGQDTKLIVITYGTISEFVMNDKCSAGTGRFLEVMANTLSVTPGGLCYMASRGGETRISSLCTVFAESEVINLIGMGKPREDIAWGVVDSIAQKVKAQAGKLRLGGGPLCLTGGLCDFPFVRERLEKAFGREVRTSPDARFAGALGAALTAAAL
jgi:predicted CoA-substrate-specific enzyme activase